MSIALASPTYRRLAAMAITATAFLAAGPAADVARAADRPQPRPPAVRGHHRDPLTTLDASRTSREPQAAGTSTSA